MGQAAREPQSSILRVSPSSGKWRACHQTRRKACSRESMKYRRGSRDSMRERHRISRLQTRTVELRFTPCVTWRLKRRSVKLNCEGASNPRVAGLERKEKTGSIGSFRTLRATNKVEGGRFLREELSTMGYRLSHPIAPGSSGGRCHGGVFPVTAELCQKTCRWRILLLEPFCGPVPVIVPRAVGDEDLRWSLGPAHPAHQSGGQGDPALHDGPLATGSAAFSEKRLSGQVDNRLELTENIGEFLMPRLDGQKGDIFPQLCPCPVGRAGPGKNGVPTALEAERQGPSDKARWRQKEKSSWAFQVDGDRHHHVCKCQPCVREKNRGWREGRRGNRISSPGDRCG